MKKLVALLLACMVVLSTAGGVAAKIEPATVCDSNHGQTIDSTNCRNDKFETTQNVNPNGYAPPGQN